MSFGYPASWGFQSAREISAREARDLADENDRLRREEEERREREESRQDQERRDRRERAESELRTTYSWDDAWNKGLTLAWREAQREAQDHVDIRAWHQKHGTEPRPEELEAYFASWVEFLGTGERIYHEEQRAAQERIRAIELEVLQRTADRLAEAHPGKHPETLEAIRADNHSYLVDW